MFSDGEVAMDSEFVGWASKGSNTAPDTQLFIRTSSEPDHQAGISPSPGF